MTSLLVSLLLLAAVGLGLWLDTHPWQRPERLYWGGMPTLADCLEAPPKKGVCRG